MGFFWGRVFLKGKCFDHFLDFSAQADSPHPQTGLGNLPFLTQGDKAFFLDIVGTVELLFFRGEPG